MSTLIGAVAGATTTVRKKVPPKFKLILAGDSCVAKQEYINALLNDQGRTTNHVRVPGEINLYVYIQIIMVQFNFLFGIVKVKRYVCICSPLFAVFCFALSFGYSHDDDVVKQILSYIFIIIEIWWIT